MGTAAEACALTWKNMGDAHFASGNFHEAVVNYQQALLFEPDFAVVYNKLGVALLHLGQTERAIGVFEAGLRVQPASPEIAYNLGTVLHEREEFDRAADYFRQALRLKPDYADASNSLAAIYKEQGLLDESAAQLRETLKLEPDHALAFYNLSELASEGRFQFTPEELQRLRTYQTSGHYSLVQRSLFSFTLGAVLNKQGKYDEAFACYRQANELRRTVLRETHQGFDAQKHQAFIDYLIAHKNQAHFERTHGWGIDSELPVFIVGMPRSGSTLVEQILASHPSVFGAGELGEMPRIVSGLAKTATSEFLLPNKQLAQNVADNYVQVLSRLGKGAARVTTKTLDNYLHLWIIATLFPRARIIHCRRDPLDTCVSCYFQNFQEMAFSFSLEDIGAFYRGYEKLMGHWGRVLPTPIHEVSYEDLVGNQEAVTRRLLAHCGLEWDERCLSFWSTRRPVQTASAVQVRKPVSSNSIGRWKRYRAHLGPLFQALGRSELAGASSWTGAGLPTTASPIRS